VAQERGQQTAPNLNRFTRDPPDQAPSDRPNRSHIRFLSDPGLRRLLGCRLGSMTDPFPQMKERSCVYRDATLGASSSNRSRSVLHASIIRLVRGGCAPYLLIKHQIVTGSVDNRQTSCIRIPAEWSAHFLNEISSSPGVGESQHSEGLSKAPGLQSISVTQTRNLWEPALTIASVRGGVGDPDSL
jgi:hypothetical protein